MLLKSTSVKFKSRKERQSGMICHCQPFPYAFPVPGFKLSASCRIITVSHMYFQMQLVSHCEQYATSKCFTKLSVARSTNKLKSVTDYSNVFIKSSMCLKVCSSDDQEGSLGHNMVLG